MHKIVVSLPGSMQADALPAKKQAWADQFGVLPDDIILLTGGVVAGVVEVPGELTAAREKHDKEAKAAAEKAAHEQEAAEKAAAEKAAKEAAKAAPPPELVAATPHAAPSAPTHAPASKRV